MNTDAMPADDDLTPELRQEMVRLEGVEDAALQQTAVARFPAEKSNRLESLHFQRQSGDWNEAIAREAESLVVELDQFMFLRAHALSLLMQRGYNADSIWAAEGLHPPLD